MATIYGRGGAGPGPRVPPAPRGPGALVLSGTATQFGRAGRQRSRGSDRRSSARSSAGNRRAGAGGRGGGVACRWGGLSWLLLLVGRELALGLEFVAQVVQRGGFSVALRAESRARGCGEVAEVGER